MSCLAACFALALALFAVPSGAGAAAADGVAGEPERALLGDAGSPATRDASAAAVLYLVNRIAIGAGAVADERARAPAVRALAARISTSHSAAQEQLVAWMARESASSALLEEAVRAEEAAQLRLPMWLRTVAAASFDRTYLQAMLEMNARGLRFLAAAQSAATDAALDRLIHEATTRVHAHRAAARALLGSRAQPQDAPPAAPTDGAPAAPSSGLHQRVKVARAETPGLEG